MSITLETIVSLNPEVDDEIVMMSTENGLYFGVNTIGSLIWNQLVTPSAIEKIIPTLLEKFEVSE